MYDRAMQCIAPQVQELLSALKGYEHVRVGTKGRWGQGGWGSTAELGTSVVGILGKEGGDKGRRPTGDVGEK